MNYDSQMDKFLSYVRHKVVHTVQGLDSLPFFGSSHNHILDLRTHQLVGNGGA